MTLVRGDFERGNKKSAKNVEVRISVLTKDSKNIPVSCASTFRRAFHEKEGWECHITGVGGEIGECHVTEADSHNS